MGILWMILLAVRALLLSHAAVTVENLALLKQLAVVSQSVKRPKLRPRDRVFWALLCAPLAELAHRIGDRPAGYCDMLAPARISVVLALEVAVPEARKAGHQAGGRGSDPTYVKREPDLGCAPDRV